MKKPVLFLWSLLIGALLVLIVFYNPFADSEKKEKVLLIYTWMHTFDPETIKDFEKETGITVHMDYYESDEILEAKLLTGKSGYDIVMPSATPYFGRQVLLKDKIFTPLDKSKLKNWGNLDETILSLLEALDEDNAYGIPFTWGVTGFAYDANKIKKIFPYQKLPPDSLSFVYDEEQIKKLSKCGVTLLDYPQDLVESVLYYKGIQPNYGDFSQIETARKILKKMRPHVKNFTANAGRMINDLVNGEVCLMQTWSGEALRAQVEAKSSRKPVQLEFFIPKEYQGFWCDLFVIPRGAPHLENAYKFLDFMMRGDIAARNIKYLLSPIANDAALKHLPPSLRNNPLLYPKMVFENFRINEVLTLSFERELTRMWTKTKVGQK
ncbi:MAG: extracellular solute-binding protein [Alphaproteobacteria bacterium]